MDMFYKTLAEFTSVNNLYLTEVIGYIAAFFGTVSLIPQVIKLWKVKSATSISAAMYLIYALGAIFWLIYGIMIYSIPLIVGEIITLILTSTILIMKYLWKD